MEKGDGDHSTSAPVHLDGQSLALGSYMNTLSGAVGKPNLAAGLYERDIVQLLSQALNFTYKVIISPDVIGPGVMTGPDGHWNGCMGQVERKEIDFCTSFAQTWESADKRGKFDFAFPIMWDDIGMITPASWEKEKTFIVFAPFSTLIWIVFLIAAASVTTLLWQSYRVRRKRNQKDREQTFGRWVLFVVASVSIGERGYVMYQPGSDSLTPVFRIFAIFWCLPIKVLLELYKASLQSLMTVPQQMYLIQSINELPYRPEISVYVWKGSAIDELMVGQTDGPFKMVGEQLRTHPEQRLPQGDIKRVLESIHGHRVFLLARTLCESIIEFDVQQNNPAKLHLPYKDLFYPRGRQITLPLGSNLKPILDKEILLLQQHGLIDYAARRNFKKHKEVKDVEAVRVLILHDFTGSFVILVFGICVSMIAFIFEMLVHHYIVRKNPLIYFIL